MNCVRSHAVNVEHRSGGGGFVEGVQPLPIFSNSVRARARQLCLLVELVLDVSPNVERSRSQSFAT